MRKILASIVFALLLTSCLLQFDPDYIPYNTIVHRPLGAGVYYGYGNNDVLYVLTIGSGEHYSFSDEVQCRLSLHAWDPFSQNYSRTPYAIYEGTYSHYIVDQEYRWNDPTWDIQYHIDEFDFTKASNGHDPDLMDGYVKITYEPSTAGKELEDDRYGQAYYPVIGTIVHFSADDFLDSPAFINYATTFRMGV